MALNLDESIIEDSTIFIMTEDPVATDHMEEFCNLTGYYL